MSTHATISLVKTDGTVESIYLHFDGYVDHTGKMLASNYTSVEIVESLLALGNVSELNENTDTCVAYSRDCGEPYVDNRPRVFTSEKDYCKRLDGADGLCTCEYNYIFKRNSWYVWRRGMPLACAMKLNQNSSDEEFEEGVDMVQGLLHVHA